MDRIIKISNVSELKPFKSTWRVHVKVLHSWTSIHPESGTSLEMVLADENGDKIKASCKQSLFQRFKSRCTVGEWKVITNFSLSRASGLYRHTHHVYNMHFLSQTSITDSDNVYDNMFLDLKDFSNITNGSHNTCYLIDVIGEVFDVGGLDIIRSERKEVIKLEFSLRDTNNQRIRCCIHGKLAQLLIQDDKQPANGDICLIRYAKISNYQGQLQVSNAFDSSLVLINPDIKEARALKQMLTGDAKSLELYHEKNNKIMIQEKRQRWSQVPFKTIQELKHTEKDEKCRVITTVYAIDTENGWYYFACVGCNSKVFKTPIIFGEQDLTNWWCEVCHLYVTKATPRYKLDLLVQDQTGESKFTLPDTVASVILKISAAKVLKVLKDEIKDKDMLPPEIVEIVGKTFGFGISVESMEKVNAMKVWNLDDIIMKRIKSLHQMSTYSRKKQCTDLMEIESPGHDDDREKKSG